MGISNINMLQHPEDVAYLTSNVSNNYYIHALANMGQRLGVFDETALKYNTISYKNDLNETIKISSVLDDVFTFESDLTFEIYINNIETYKQKSQILNDGKNFKSLLFGKLLGTDDEDENNIEIQYTNIDINKNVITEAWRAFYLQNDIYIVMHLSLVDTTYNKYKYKLRTYKCLIDSTFTDVRRCFTSSTYDTKNINEETLSGLMGELDVTKIGSDRGFFFTLIFGDSTSTIGTPSGFCLYSETIIENNYTLDVEIDTIGETSEQYLKITDSSALTRKYENVHDILYFDVYGLDKRVHILNIDLVKVYPNLLKYYSELRFNLNNTRLKDILVQAIYNQLYNEYYENRIINEASELDEKIPTLEIGPDFEIVYLSKVDNALKIYYTNDIYINLKNFDDNKSVKEFPLTFRYNGNSKISVYNISVNYNEKYPEFIDTIDVIKKYTLPYINDSNYWVINDCETSNYSLGEDAGNPNIMILKTTKINGKIDHIKLNRFDIYDEDLEYENLYVSNIMDHNNNHYLFYVPKVLYGNNKLKYANLIIISDVAQDEDHNTVMTEPYTTLWTINKDSDKFEMIKDINGESLSLNDLLGMDTYMFNKLNDYEAHNNVFEDLIGLKVYNNLLINDTLSANETDSYRILTLSTLKNNDFSKPENNFNYNHIYMRMDTEGYYPDDVHEIHMSYTRFTDKTKYIDLNQTTSSPYSYSVQIMNVASAIEDISGIKKETRQLSVYPGNSNSSTNSGGSSGSSTGNNQDNGNTNTGNNGDDNTRPNTGSTAGNFNGDTSGRDPGNTRPTAGDASSQNTGFSGDISANTGQVLPTTGNTGNTFNAPRTQSVQIFGQEASISNEITITSSTVADALPMMPRVSDNTTTTASTTASNLIVDDADFNVVIDNGNANVQHHIAYVVNNGSQIIYVTTDDDFGQIESMDEYYCEYVPTAYVPMFDTSEILLLNQNIINRTNILSFDKNNNIYYSYIGTVYDTDNKNELHIGTATTDINVGTQTLFSKYNQFNKQDILSIDFPHLNLNVSDITINQQTPVTHNEVNDSITFSLNVFPAKYFDLKTNNAVNNTEIVRQFEEIRVNSNNLTGSTNGEESFLLYLERIAKTNKMIASRKFDTTVYSFFINKEIISTTLYDNNNSETPKYLDLSGIYIKSGNNNYIIFDEPVTFTVFPLDKGYYLHSKLFTDLTTSNKTLYSNN